MAFAAFGSIRAFAAAMLGYAAGRSVPPVVLLALLFLFSLFVFLVSHSMWIRAEDAEWQPDPAAGRRRRRR